MGLYIFKVFFWCFCQFFTYLFYHMLTFAKRKLVYTKWFLWSFIFFISNLKNLHAILRILLRSWTICFCIILYPCTLFSLEIDSFAYFWTGSFPKNAFFFLEFFFCRTLGTHKYLYTHDLKKVAKSAKLRAQKS